MCCCEASRRCHLRTKTPLRPPHCRGSGIGRRLTEAALQAARVIGYTRIRLDTLPQMQRRSASTNLGFHDIPAYYGEPMHGQRFMEADSNLNGTPPPRRTLHPSSERSLLEKEITTPEYYPLTVNALVNACNQKSNRDPVVNYTEEVVQQALALLRHKGLAVRISGAGHRVEKYGHLLGEKLNLGRRESARALHANAARPANRRRTPRPHRAHVRIHRTSRRRTLPGISSHPPARTPGRPDAPRPLVPTPRRRCPIPPKKGRARAPSHRMTSNIASPTLEREVAELKQMLESFRRQFE